MRPPTLRSRSIGVAGVVRGREPRSHLSSLPRASTCGHGWRGAPRRDPFPLLACRHGQRVGEHPPGGCSAKLGFQTYRGLCEGRDLTGRGVQPALGDYPPAFSSVSKQHAVK